MWKLVFVGIAACGGGGQSPSADAPVVTCVDDGPLEPNDSAQSAFVTPTGVPSFQVRAAVCPATDRDFYAVDVVTDQTLEARVTGETSVLALVISTADTPIANGQPGQEPREVVATIPNLPAGRFFVQIGGAFADNYQLQIAVR